MLDFVDDKFTLLVDDEEYLFSQLPEEYRRVIEGYMFPYYIVHEESAGMPITDEDKITWFKFINFAGTQQEKEHMQSLQ